MVGSVNKMSKNKKYSSKIEQIDAHWQATINRQVTANKTIVSKEKGGFTSESEAEDWANEQLQKFTATLSESNKRHGEQRKINAEERAQRSTRRAEKTQLSKETIEAQDSTE